jgi:nucleoside-diphosphate-sugar epimerase
LLGTPAKNDSVVVDNIAFGAVDVTSTLAILKGNIGHYILTSTVAVYIGARPFRMPLTEADAVFELEAEPAFAGFVQPTPEWMVNYAGGKIAAEQVVIGQADVPYTIIRPPNVTGPNDPTGRCQFYIQRIMDGQPVILTNGGVQSMQPVYRRDLAIGYMQAMAKEAAKNQDSLDAPGYEDRKKEIDFARQFGELVSSFFASTSRKSLRSRCRLGSG